MTIVRETPGERDLRRLRVFYRALGDETRLRIIGLLAEGGPMPVNALSAGVGLSQPLISWHLRILRLAAFEELHEAEARLIGGTAGVKAAGSATGHGEVPDVG